MANNTGPSAEAVLKVAAELLRARSYDEDEYMYWIDAVFAAIRDAGSPNPWANASDADLAGELLRHARPLARRAC